MKSELRNPIMDSAPALQHILEIVPVLMAASIATVASVVKFKKFQDRMEGMIRAIEVCVEVTFLLKKLQESIRVAPSYDDIIEIKKDYSTTYDAYCKAQEMVERVIKYEDVVNHLPKFHSMQLKIRTSEESFEKNKDFDSVPATRRRNIPCCLVS
jgi:hypothetical protein